MLNICELKIWLMLMALTLTSFYLGVSHSLLLSAVLVITWFKGFLLVGQYMELQNAPRIWKYVVNGYLIFIMSIIAIVTLW